MVAIAQSGKALARAIIYEETRTYTDTDHIDSPRSWKHSWRSRVYMRRGEWDVMLRRYMQTCQSTSIHSERLRNLCTVANYIEGGGGGVHDLQYSSAER